MNFRRVLILLCFVVGIPYFVYADGYQRGSGFNEGDLDMQKYSVQFHEVDNTPSCPPSDEIKVYAKDSSGDTKVYTLDSACAETELGAGSSAINWSDPLNAPYTGWTDDGTVVRLTTSTDNVGVGTTNSLARLHVKSATASTIPVIIQTSDDSETNNAFQLYSSAGSPLAAITPLGRYLASGSATRPAFAFIGSGNTTTGYYGVGSPISDVRFTIAGTEVFRLTVGSSPGFQLASGGDVTWSSGAVGSSGDTGLSRFSAGLVQVTNGNIASPTAANLTAANVGIGTTNMQATLTVLQTAASDALRVNDVAGDTTPFIIDQSGNVGIGTSTVTSGFKLDVGPSGKGRFQGGIRIQCNGAAFGNGGKLTSDSNGDVSCAADTDTTGGWTDAGSVVHTTTNSDTVGIGAGSTSRLAKLLVEDTDNIVLTKVVGAETANVTCSDYGDEGSCDATVVCTSNLSSCGSPSPFDQSTCEAQGSGSECAWNDAGDCTLFVTQEDCEAEGQCTTNTHDCGSYGDEGSCNGAASCSWQTDGDCTPFGEEDCNATSGCSPNNYDCSQHNGDQGACEGASCTWEDPNCTGDYFVDCSGNYNYCAGGVVFDNCTGSYNSCTGDFFNSCDGGVIADVNQTTEMSRWIIPTTQSCSVYDNNGDSCDAEGDCTYDTGGTNCADYDSDESGCNAQGAECSWNDPNCSDLVGTCSGTITNDYPMFYIKVTTNGGVIGFRTADSTCSYAYLNNSNAWVTGSETCPTEP